MWIENWFIHSFLFFESIVFWFNFSSIILFYLDFYFYKKFFFIPVSEKNFFQALRLRSYEHGFKIQAWAWNLRARDSALKKLQHWLYLIWHFQFLNIKSWLLILQLIIVSKTFISYCFFRKVFQEKNVQIEDRNKSLT